MKLKLMDSYRRKVQQQYSFNHSKRPSLHYYGYKKERKIGKYIKKHDKNFDIQKNNNAKVKGKLLLQYLSTTDDFPDYELSEKVKIASKEFRKNFKLRYY